MSDSTSILTAEIVSLRSALEAAKRELAESEARRKHDESRFLAGCAAPHPCPCCEDSAKTKRELAEAKKEIHQGNEIALDYARDRDEAKTILDFRTKQLHDEKDVSRSWEYRAEAAEKERDEARKELEYYKDRFVDERGTVWVRPTPEAYYRCFKQRDEAEERARVAVAEAGAMRETLTFVLGIVKWMRSKVCAYGPKSSFCDCKRVKACEDNPKDWATPQKFNANGEHTGCVELRDAEGKITTALTTPGPSRLILDVVEAARAVDKSLGVNRTSADIALHYALVKLDGGSHV